jgi:hypothetical protein
LPKWQRIQPGDVALFARESRIIASATVSHKAHNPQLARELWDVDEDGDTWEYLYFLDRAPAFCEFVWLVTWCVMHERLRAGLSWGCQNPLRPVGSVAAG